MFKDNTRKAEASHVNLSLSFVHAFFFDPTKNEQVNTKAFLTLIIYDKIIN